jgi:N6-adenosine-specific RNA methylase IME4
MSNALAVISQARQMLEQAKTLDDVLEIRDKAAAAKVYFKAANESVELMNAAVEVKLRAERKAGEMLAGMDSIKKGSKCNTELHLNDIGISRIQSSRWQQLHRVPDEVFEQHVRSVIESRRELTTKGVLKLAARQPTPIDPIEPGDLPHDSAIVSDMTQVGEQKFGTVYADPPWNYGNQATRASTDNHYDTMSIEDLCNMPVRDVVADDAHLHLWTTNGFLREAFDVIDAWGFEYRSCFVWCKPQMGIGNYWRVSHEFMLLGIRGNAKRFAERNHMSWMELERREHSAKPEKIRGIIERVSPGPYLELFGRKAVQGWTVLGNQVDMSAKLFN